ncbi:hypothetical protein SASPL_143801 [Salvia splendens]|uniref:Uncharacterized protein n=1 Tax=Salvia splendens TaxID=180675 RepID=A0A8X8ZAC0_SALSN|nr:hypothetical protein SASPL_143801 [Salvia splendens]
MIGVSTHYQASKILIYADVDEVEEFRNRLKDDDTFIEQGSMDQTGVKHSREFDDLNVKSIGDVVCLEDGSYWVFGKVESIEFVVNIVDDTSNASLLLWDREVVQLIGKRVWFDWKQYGEIVDKHVPLNIGSEVLNSDVKLADLLFGADIVEATGKGLSHLIYL